MAKKNSGGDALAFMTGAVKGYADIMADRTKIQGDIMINKIKTMDNWFGKMQMMQEQDAQNKRNIDYMIKAYGGGQPAATTPVGGTTTVNTTSGAPPATPGPKPELAMSPSGKLYVKSSTTGGWGAAYIKEAKEIAPTIAEAVKRGDTGALVGQPQWVVAEVKAQLAKEGHDLSKISKDVITLQSQARTAGTGQIVRFNSSVDSLQQSLDVLDKLSDQYSRSDIFPSIANRIKITYDKELGANGQVMSRPRFNIDTKGMTDSQQQLAIRYISQLNFTKDTLALVYSGGYAPQQWAYDMAMQNINPYYGQMGQKAATMQARIEIGIRANSMTKALGQEKRIQTNTLDSGGIRSNAPAIGTIEQGTNGKYRFKGGNPADSNSWEPI